MTNPNLYHAVPVSVVDVTDIPGATCVVTDGDAMVDADSTMVFSYECSFDEEPWYEASNVAQVTSKGELFTDLVLVDFIVDVETDKTVTVMDDKTDPANPVVLGDAEWKEDGTPIEFPYTLTHEGVAGQCIVIENTAWLDFAMAGADGDGEVDVISPTSLLSPLAEVVALAEASSSVSTEICTEAELSVGVNLDAVNAASYDREYLWGTSTSQPASPK